ncbi:MAG: hypothetical protein H6R05_844 [Burkholderiaceae bacterium]|nr:hypothetical protein [Burkholderiaceae bacterium]
MCGFKMLLNKRVGKLKNDWLALLLPLFLFGCQQTTPPTSTEKQAIQTLAPIAQLHLEWADTAQERQMGLMNRTSLPENAGMVFVFEQTQPHCFWMKNTLIPLDIGFIDAQGRLVQIESMQAQTTDVHCPNQAIKYALETNQGWFDKHQITVGTQILNIPQ